MQPKTKEPLPQEAKKEQRERTPVEQWDQLAFTLIRQELAPKGYSEIKRGPWRGKVQSNIPFLPKSSVERCQKVAAQLVRAYRDKVRIEIEAGMAQLEKVQIKYQEELNDCHFWQFKRKSDISHNLRSVMGQSGSLIHVLNQLNNIGIK